MLGLDALQSNLYQPIQQFFNTGVISPILAMKQLVGILAPYLIAAK